MNQQLIDLYVTQQKSLSEVGKLLGMNKQSVRLKLIEYGIKRRSSKHALKLIKKNPFKFAKKEVRNVN